MSQAAKAETAKGGKSAPITGDLSSYVQIYLASDKMGDSVPTAAIL